jgi:DNA-binding response OmpR family regulator
MSKPTVMIVDDVESNRMLLKMILEDDYNIIECISGTACLHAVKQKKPEIVLLDVNMPGISGYEVCIELRKNKASATLPVIFISALDTVEERLAGFEAGGNDYITKPINPEHVIDRVQFFIDHQAEINNAKTEANTAMQVAMEAMTSSSELGQIIEFVKSAQDISTLEGVGKKFCTIARSFGLSAGALIHTFPPVYINCSPDSMEGRVLSRFKNNNERIVSIGIRTLINSAEIGILISNMPIEDESRYGRLKDHLAVLSSICEGRIKAIKTEIGIKDQRREILTRVTKMTEEQVEKFNKKLKTHDDRSRQIMLDMITELEAKLFTLGLDEDQEQQLMMLAYDASERLEDMKKDTKQLEDELVMILEGLYGVLEHDK